MTVAVLGCVWVLAATACALMPMRLQRYIGLPLLIIAPVLLGAIFVSYGALAFGLAASSFFPVIVLGIFSKRTTREGAISGMISGLAFTSLYILFFKFIMPEKNNAAHWWFGISPEGIGTLGMILNFAVTLLVSRFTPAPPLEVQAAVDAMHSPSEED